MKKYFIFSNSVLFLTVIVSIGTIFVLFSNFSQVSYYWFFNSDTLYLPSIYKDIFIDHNSLQGWHFNPAPNFFPDMIIYFLLMAITSKFIVTSFFFAVLQYLVFMYLIVRLFKAIELPNFKLIATLSILFLLLFFMVSFFSKDFDFTFYLISNSYHTGAFIMSLFCTILAIEFIRKKKKNTLVNLAVISLLSVFSDRLVIVLFNIPWLILMFFYFKIENRKSLFFVNIVNILTAIVGLAAFYYLSKCDYVVIDQPHRIMEFQHFDECLKLLLSQMLKYLTDCDFKSLIIVFSSITFVSIFIISVKKFLSQHKLGIIEIYFVLSAIFVLVVFFAPVVNGNYTGFDTFRYNVYIFYLLIINFGILINFFIRRFKINTEKILKNLIIVLITGASINIFYQYNYKGFIGYLNYYPKDVESIDNISKHEKLYCGLGQYWTAKFTTMFSKNGVRVFSSNNAIEPYFHVMNENWFIKNKFNFVISDNNEQENIVNNLFKNIRIIKNHDITLILTPEFSFNNETQKIEISQK